MKTVERSVLSVLAGFVCLGLSTLGLISGFDFSSPGLLLGIFLSTILLELLATPLQGFGRFSAAFPVYLTAAVIPEIGTGWAVASLLLANSIAALRSHREPDLLMLETFAEAIPNLIAILAPLFLTNMGLISAPLSFHGLVAAAMLYLLTGRAVPDMVLQRMIDAPSTGELNIRVRPVTAALAFAGPVLVGAVTSSPVYGPFLLPLLFVLNVVIETMNDKEPMAATERKSNRLNELQKEVNDTKASLESANAERSLLEKVSKAFAANPNLTTALDTTINAITKVVPCDSIVFFMDTEENLAPVHFRSPFSERLASSSLLGVGEPIVEECWRKQKIILSQSYHLKKERLMRGEHVCVALPLRGLGVLYVGKQKKGRYTRGQLRMVASIADQTVPAVMAARRRTELETSVHHQAEANRHLEETNYRQSILLNGLRELASTLDRNEILNRLSDILKALMPPGAILIAGVEKKNVDWWKIQPRDVTAGDHAENLVLSVYQNQKPLLLEEPKQSRFGDAFPDARSLLAVPLTSEDARLGVIVLLSEQEKAYQRGHQDLIYAVSFSTAAVLRNSLLHQQVVETQGQLVQSSKLAAVGQLAAGVAHEINSPLGAVLLALNLAAKNAKKQKTEQVVKHLKVAERAANGAKEIIAKLLEYSRRAPRKSEPVDLSDVARNALEFLETSFESKHVDTTANLNPTSPVLATANELQQVVTNLLVNARDAALTKGREPKVEIYTGSQNGRAYVEVRDNGPGIPEEVRERVFEPFFTTKPVGKGTGLGLSVSQQLVSRHGGHLELVDPGPDTTTFRLSFPLES